MKFKVLSSKKKKAPTTPPTAKTSAVTEPDNSPPAKNQVQDGAVAAATTKSTTTKTALKQQPILLKQIEQPKTQKPTISKRKIATKLETKPAKKESTAKQQSAKLTKPLRSSSSKRPKSLIETSTSSSTPTAKATTSSSSSSKLKPMTQKNTAPTAKPNIITISKQQKSITQKDTSKATTTARATTEVNIQRSSGRFERTGSGRGFEIKTKKRSNSNSEKIHVEKRHISTRIKRAGDVETAGRNNKEKMLSKSPFTQNAPRLDRTRAERASITSIERVSRSPLRAQTAFAKCSSPSLSACSFHVDRDPNAFTFDFCSSEKSQSSGNIFNKNSDNTSNNRIFNESINQNKSSPIFNNTSNVGNNNYNNDNKNNNNLTNSKNNIESDSNNNTFNYENLTTPPRPNKRAATSLGFREEKPYDNLSSDDDRDTIEHDKLTVLNDTIDNDEPSFDDGYHSLRTARDDPWSSLDRKNDPWSSFETDTLNANNNAICFKLKSTPNLAEPISHDPHEDEDDSYSFLNPKRISAIKRRSKNARYSVCQPLLDINSIHDDENAPFDSLSLGNRHASESALTRRNAPLSARRSIDRRRNRGKEINRSMTLYWDEAVESPTAPENLVFNVSMNAKIQTCYTDTILHSASTNGNLDIARFYVDSGQYLNAENGFRNTPLHCAITSQQKEIIDILVDKELDLSIQNIDGNTTLHLAVRAGMENLVTRIVAMGTKNTNEELLPYLNLQNKDGDTALHIGVRQNNHAIVETLLGCEDLKLDVQNNDLETVLHISEKLGKKLKTKIVQLAIQKDSENHLSELNQSQDSIDDNVVEDSQSVQSSNGNNEKISSLNQSKDSSQNHVNEGNQSQHQNKKKKKKCIGNIEDRHGNTLLHAFASQNERELLEMVLSLSCTKTKIKNEDHETSLHVAVKRSSFDLIRPLIKENLELLNMPDRNGDTILHYAIKTDNVALTDELIKLGADLNRRNDIAQSPLHLSVIGENAAILRLLLKRNANMRVRNNEGDLLIHMIAKVKNESIIQTFGELYSAHRTGKKEF